MGSISERNERNSEEGDRGRPGQGTASMQADPEPSPVVRNQTQSNGEQPGPGSDGSRDGDGAANNDADVSATAPPWQRAVAVTQPDESALHAVEVGEPQHATQAPAPTSGEGDGGAAERADDAADERSTGLLDAPTGFVAPVHEEVDDQPEAGTAVFDRSAWAAPESSEQAASSRPTSSMRVGPTRVPRRANLQLKALDPWSVLKLSLVLSVAGFFVWMVAVGVLYSVLAGMGVWDQLNNTYAGLTSIEGGSGEELISTGAVFGVAAVIGLINIVLFTAVATVASYIYNVAADMAGGIEVTLSERD